MDAADSVDMTIDDFDESPEESIAWTAYPSNAKNQSYHETMKARVKAYPSDIRALALGRLSGESRGDITKVLQNRTKLVPGLAKKLGVSNDKLNKALDVLALIRRM